jgi:3-deoxy-7-phosphoheptulonate synthase
MLVVMNSHATAEHVETVLTAIRRMSLTPHPVPGATRTAIGITGNISAVDPRGLEVLPGVEELLRVTKPYKLASREMHAADTFVRTPQTTIGPGTFTLIAGPCSVENEAMIFRTAEFLVGQGVRLMRAGAFKPRSSPYAFQGLGLEGLELLREAADAHGLAVVTEVLDVRDVDAVAERADMLQIGARNMQNFGLLREVGATRKPVLLKRGISATLEEWLMAAEYVYAAGSHDIVLCERGIRSFDQHTRNLLDLAAVPTLHALTHLPVVVDPSHGTGVRALVAPMSLAALAAGADGLLVEVHPNPAAAFSDGPQSLTLPLFADLMVRLGPIARAVGRTLPAAALAV